MSLTDAEKNRLKKVGLTGLNKPKRTPNHPTKKGVVAVRDGKKMKIIRFGDQKMEHQQLSGRTNYFGARVAAGSHHRNHKSKSSASDHIDHPLQHPFKRYL